MRILPLRGNVYMLVGAGANITLSIGKEGVLLVDAGTASDSGQGDCCRRAIGERRQRTDRREAMRGPRVFRQRVRVVARHRSRRRRRPSRFNTSSTPTPMRITRAATLRLPPQARPTAEVPGSASSSAS